MFIRVDVQGLLLARVGSKQYPATDSVMVWVLWWLGASGDFAKHCGVSGRKGVAAASMSSKESTAVRRRCRYEDQHFAQHGPLPLDAAWNDEEKPLCPA